MAYLPKVPHIVGDDDGEEQQIPQKGNEFNDGELSELDSINSDEEDGEEGEDWSQNVHYIDQPLGYALELEEAAPNQAEEFSYPAEDNNLFEIKDEIEFNEGDAESDYNIWKDSTDNKVEIESLVDPNEHSIQLAVNNDPPAMSQNVRESTLMVEEEQIPSRRLRSSFRSKSEKFVSIITLPRSRQAITKVPTISGRTPKGRIATKNMKRLREPLETLTVRPLDVTQYFAETSARLVSNRLDEGAFMEMRDQIDRLVDEAIAKTKLFQKHLNFAPRSLF